MKRILLTLDSVHSIHSKRPITPEEAWYYVRSERDVAACSFWLDAPPERELLFDFFIPREVTELVDNPHHHTGKTLKFVDEMRDWSYVDAMDMSTYGYRWTRPIEEVSELFQNNITFAEIERHQHTLMHGWLKLICVWLNDNLPELAYQLPWWENYLREEMCDFVQLYHQIATDGIHATVKSPIDIRAYRKWEKIAACCVELISGACPTIAAILRVDQGQSYPALYTGLKEYEKTQGGL